MQISLLRRMELAAVARGRRTATPAGCWRPAPAFRSSGRSPSQREIKQIVHSDALAKPSSYRPPGFAFTAGSPGHSGDALMFFKVWINHTADVNTLLNINDKGLVISTKECRHPFLKFTHRVTYVFINVYDFRLRPQEEELTSEISPITPLLYQKRKSL